MNKTSRNTSDEGGSAERVMNINRRMKSYKEKKGKFGMIAWERMVRFEYISLGQIIAKERSEKQIDLLCAAQERLNISDSDGAQLAMSYIDQEVEKNNLKEGLKQSSGVCRLINAEVGKDSYDLSRSINTLKQQFSEEGKSINEDNSAHSKAILAYKSSLNRMDKKHPWLKNPQLDLAHIDQEAKTLASMQEEKEALEKELKVYNGLAADMNKALMQLAEAKKEQQELKDKFRQAV